MYDYGKDLVERGKIMQEKRIITGLTSLSR